ncbi:MAG: hypothetical protein LQ347_007105, partial [Umbilicaria vellea]
LNGLGTGARYDGTLQGTSYIGSCAGKAVGTVAALSATDKTNMRKFIEAQLDAYERHTGWIFWAWKTESAPEWHMKDLLAEGVFPLPLGSRKCEFLRNPGGGEAEGESGDGRRLLADAYVPQIRNSAAIKRADSSWAVGRPTVVAWEGIDSVPHSGFALSYHPRRYEQTIFTLHTPLPPPSLVSRDTV